MKNILPAGKYEGKSGLQKCIVTAETREDFVSATSEGFGLLNSANGIVINDSTGEIAATQSMRAPFYLNGGTKFLNIKANDIDQVEVSISKILLDHRGNDASTYLECTVSL
ncbi:MAG: hypothetical protein H7177_09545 [Rhizobacter sp.]|nr:hypothetical protein [Bacteriovorax sp.]